MTDTKRDPSDRRGPATTEILRLVVTLDDVRPVITRTLLMRASSALSTLHTAIQQAMPWEDSHLHEFLKDELVYGPDYYAAEVDDYVVHSERKQLGTLFRTGSDEIRYLYDFGDGWQHTIRLDARLPPDLMLRHPRCSAGENACPPEDVGGAGGYMDYLEAILIPTHPEHAQMLAWRGPGFDPAYFDIDAANARLAQAFGFTGLEKVTSITGTTDRPTGHAVSTVSTGSTPPEPDTMEALLKDIEAALPDSLTESDDGMMNLFATLSDQAMPQPEVDFQGLSPADMHRLLYFPLESPDIVVLPEILEDEPVAPVMKLFDHLSAACGENGLKATQKGNLPRALVQEIGALQLIPEALDPYAHRRGRLNSESDFVELETLRYLAGFAGLIVYRKGRFHQSAKLKKLCRKAGNRAVYPQLLRTWTTEFDWGWADGYSSLSIIQQSWVFLLYVMQCLPDDELPATLIGDSFVQAFPMALEEVAESERFGEQDDHGVRDALIRAVQLRAVERFAIFFGLLDSRLERGEKLFERSVFVRPAPLLRQVARFNPELFGR